MAAVNLAGNSHCSVNLTGRSQGHGQPHGQQPLQLSTSQVLAMAAVNLTGSSHGTVNLTGRSHFSGKHRI